MIMAVVTPARASSVMEKIVVSLDARDSAPIPETKLTK